MSIVLSGFGLCFESRSIDRHSAWGLNTTGTSPTTRSRRSSVAHFRLLAEPSMFCMFGGGDDDNDDDDDDDDVVVVVVE
jgi:hypothetical protein